MPMHPSQLGMHWGVLYASPGNGRVEAWEWRENGILRSQPLAGRVTVNSAEAYIACCLAGLGLIQIPAYDVGTELAAGKLLEVLPGYRADPMPMHLLFPHRRHPSQRLRVFVEWMQQVLGEVVG